MILFDTAYNCKNTDKKDKWTKTDQGFIDDKQVVVVIAWCAWKLYGLCLLDAHVDDEGWKDKVANGNHD